MMVPVRQLLGIGGIPAHRGRATDWLRRAGVALHEGLRNGRPAAVVHLCDLPDATRAAFEAREAGASGGAVDDAAWAAFLALPRSAQETGRRKAALFREAQAMRDQGASLAAVVAELRARHGDKAPSIGALHGWFTVHLSEVKSPVGGTLETGVMRRVVTLCETALSDVSICVTGGPSGIGKTTALMAAVEQLGLRGHRVAMVTAEEAFGDNAHRTIKEVILSANSNYEYNSNHSMSAVCWEHLAANTNPEISVQSLLIVDKAQDLKPKALHALFSIWQRQDHHSAPGSLRPTKGFGMVLCGNDEFVKQFSRFGYGLHELFDYRLSVALTLPSSTSDELGLFLRRQGWRDADAIGEVVEFAKGRGDLYTVCDIIRHVQRMAKSGPVTTEHIQSVIRMKLPQRGGRS